jgi:rhodanese-related sulfurtransferase
VQLKLLKEILGIVILSSVIALTYNTISDKGISLIRKGIELKWESDTSIDNFVKKDSLAALPVNKLSSENGIKYETLPAENSKNPKKDTVKIVTGVKERSSKAGKDSIPNKTPTVKNKIEFPEVTKIITPTAITVEQAYKLYNGGATFLDARIEADYNNGHIKGAILMPLKKIDQYLSKISSVNKDACLICYCDGSGCDLSIDLAKKLSELGYRNVKIFYSGWNDWKEKNYPME